MKSAFSKFKILKHNAWSTLCLCSIAKNKSQIRSRSCFQRQSKTLNSSFDHLIISMINSNKLSSKNIKVSLSFFSSLKSSNHFSKILNHLLQYTSYLQSTKTTTTWSLRLKAPLNSKTKMSSLKNLLKFSLTKTALIKTWTQYFRSITTLFSMKESHNFTATRSIPTSLASKSSNKSNFPSKRSSTSTNKSSFSTESETTSVSWRSSCSTLVVTSPNLKILLKICFSRPTWELCMSRITKGIYSSVSLLRTNSMIRQSLRSHQNSQFCNSNLNWSLICVQKQYGFRWIISLTSKKKLRIRVGFLKIRRLWTQYLSLTRQKGCIIER